MKRTTILAALLSTLSACDAADCMTPPGHERGLAIAGPPVSGGGDVRPRGDEDPELWVVTAWEKNTIDTWVAAKHVLTCVATHNPTWTCSLSFYKPNATQPNFVGGIGCSAWFPPALKDCLLTAYQKNDAIQY